MFFVRWAFALKSRRETIKQVASVQVLYVNGIAMLAFGANAHFCKMEISIIHFVGFGSSTLLRALLTSTAYSLQLLGVKTSTQSAIS